MESETTTEDPPTVLGPNNSKFPPPVGDDYDQMVRELAFAAKGPNEDGGRSVNTPFFRAIPTPNVMGLTTIYPTGHVLD